MYKKTQFGWIGFWLVMAIVVSSVVYAFSIDDGDEKRTIMLTLAIPLVILWVFKDLTVSVDDEFISVSYGIGFIKFKQKLSEIESCKKIKKAFVLGWGIRFGFRYTLYNISGRDSVELTFKNDKKRKVRIGTADLDGLYEAINSKIK